MLGNILCNWSSHIGRKSEDLQKHIYQLKVIYTGELASFINRTEIIPTNIILSRYDVSLKLLFDKLLTKLMSCQGFNLFIGTHYYEFTHFQSQQGCSFIYDK